MKPERGLCGPFNVGLVCFCHRRSRFLFTARISFQFSACEVSVGPAGSVFQARCELLSRALLLFVSVYCPAGCRNVTGDVWGSSEQGYRDVSRDG